MKGRSSVVVRSTCPPWLAPLSLPSDGADGVGGPSLARISCRSRRRWGSSSESTSSSRRTGPLAGALLHHGDLGQLDRERRRALLAAGAEAIEVHPVHGEGQIVAVRADDGRALAPLPLLLRVKLGGELRGNGRSHVISHAGPHPAPTPTRTVAR